MNAFILYLYLLKASVMSFSGLGPLPIVHEDLVVRHRVITDRQLSAAVAAGRMGPGPIGLWIVSVGYFAAGVPGAVAGWAAMISPAFLIIPMLLFLGVRAGHRRLRSMIQAMVVAAAGLIVTATLSLARDAITTWQAGLIAAAAFAVLMTTRIDTFWVMFAAAAAGILFALI